MRHQNGAVQLMNRKNKGQHITAEAKLREKRRWSATPAPCKCSNLAGPLRGRGSHILGRVGYGRKKSGIGDDQQVTHELRTHTAFPSCLKLRTLTLLLRIYRQIHVHRWDVFRYTSQPNID